MHNICSRRVFLFWNSKHSFFIFCSAFNHGAVDFQNGKSNKAGPELERRGIHGKNIKRNLSLPAERVTQMTTNTKPFVVFLLVCLLLFQILLLHTDTPAMVDGMCFISSGVCRSKKKLMY